MLKKERAYCKVNFVIQLQNNNLKAIIHFTALHNYIIHRK